jgi:hypothetical protein
LGDLCEENLECGFFSISESVETSKKQKCSEKNKMSGASNLEKK